MIRILAAISVILAAGCAGLAVAWSEKHDEALCWQEAFETGDPPSAGVC